uniref:Uncharacterized protein n=1 Tax=Triticum urartu TaxID=4572 RepID=A0A8R7QWX2_TRIUA
MGTLLRNLQLLFLNYETKRIVCTALHFNCVNIYNIIPAAVGRNHTVVVTSEGENAFHLVTTCMGGRGSLRNGE